MGIEAQGYYCEYFAQCDHCAAQWDGDDAPTRAEAVLWARAEGWVFDSDGTYATCPDCIKDAAPDHKITIEFPTEQAQITWLLWWHHHGKDSYEEIVAIWRDEHGDPDAEVVAFAVVEGEAIRSIAYKREG